MVKGAMKAFYTLFLPYSAQVPNWVKIHKQSVEHVFSGPSVVYKCSRVVAKGITYSKIWELLEAFGSVKVNGDWKAVQLTLEIPACVW